MLPLELTFCGKLTKVALEKQQGHMGERGSEGESKKHVWPDPGAPAANGQSLSLLQRPKSVSKICPLPHPKEDLTYKLCSCPIIRLCSH